MEKRRNTSSNYPNSPHERIDKNAGERSKGYNQGNYDRDIKSDKFHKSEKGGKKKQNKKENFKGKPKGSVRSNLIIPEVVSNEQITDGKYRGVSLSVSESPKLSPTNLHLRIALFKILFRKVRAKRFLDVCAGAGVVGLDAISRGALIATFVERKARQVSLIRSNIELLGVSEGHGEVFQQEAAAFLKNMSKRRRFWDIVYFAPPDEYDYEEALVYFRKGAAIEKGGIFVIEHHSEMFFPESMGILNRWKVITHDDRAMSFFERDD